VKARVYIWEEGESIMDNFLRDCLAERGVDVAELKWSQKAGCSCGCSPGFIDTAWQLRSDLHITIGDPAIIHPKTIEAACW
jgi:hypothetical protein